MELSELSDGTRREEERSPYLGRRVDGLKAAVRESAEAIRNAALVG